MANKNAFDLSGSIALITGSTRGIGFELARGLAEAGAVIVLNGRSEEHVRSAAETLEKEGHNVHYSVFDASVHDAVKAAVAKVEKEVGPIDILINNAGIQRRAPLEDFKEEDWNAIISTNLSSVFFTSQAVANHMIPRKHGKIVNICSVQSTLSRPNIAPYAASKGGVAMFTKAQCTDWAKHGLQINGVAPGYFATEMNKALVEDEKFSSWLLNRTPAGRWGDVKDLIGAVVFLSSSASDFVNGQVIYVDGGLTASV